MPFNSRINKSGLTSIQKRQIRKTFKQTQNTKILASNYTHTQSNTTLANISDFRLPVEAGKTYIYTLALTCTANTSGGAKFGVTAPTASYVTGQVQADGTSTSSTSLSTITATVASGSTAIEFLAVGTYKATDNGYFQIQAAQGTSHASDTVVLAGSFLRLEEVIL